MWGEFESLGEMSAGFPIIASLISLEAFLGFSLGIATKRRTNRTGGGNWSGLGLQRDHFLVESVVGEGIEAAL
jgi:hypothetical protein